MAEEPLNIAEQFPTPARGVPIFCPLRFDDLARIPLIYFGRETRGPGKKVPESPVPTPQPVSASQRISNNPLNSIIRKWEAQFALQGGVQESGEFVSSNGRGDDRYYHADEWLDDGADEEGDSGEYIGEVDLDAFKVIAGSDDNDDGSLDDDQLTEESDHTDNEQDGDDAGGNWQLLLRRLDSGRQSIVRDLVTEMETFQAFPGHTKQKKQKHLRDSVARLRRLLPKVNQIQSQWQSAVWNVVFATNDTANMQSFMDMWNEVAATKQKDDIIKERDELVLKFSDSVKEAVLGWKRGECIVRSKSEVGFNHLVRIWELWVQEEECAGRIVSALVPGKSVSKSEKRFASILAELVVDKDVLSAEVIPILLRVAFFGTKKPITVAKKTSTTTTTQDDEEPIPLPATVYIYRRNELLKCKLVEIKSLTSVIVHVTDKEWDSAEPTGDAGVVEFTSLHSLFESYQQKFVRKQDRITLPTPFDAWKYFAVKPTTAAEYVILYDAVAKASAVSHFGFTDKAGLPVFLPQISTARSAELERRKKLDETKDERKRKRDELEARAKEIDLKNPPCSDQFIPFPQFDKDLFATESVSSAPPTVAVDGEVDQD